MTEVKRKSNVKNALIIGILFVVGVYIWAAIIGNYSASRTLPVVKPDNTAALQNCIDTNVTPLQKLAIVGNNQTYVNDAQVALDSCKTQYPTN